jgi:hemoglobin-like flavoprotein
MRALIRNAQQLQILRESIAQLKPSLDTFAFRSYRRYFLVLPAELNSIPATELLALLRDLVATFEAAIQYADRPERLMSLISPVASRTLSLKGMRPVHLGILINCMMTSAGELLGSDWTAEVENAWDEALHSLLLAMLKGVRTPTQAAGD